MDNKNDYKESANLSKPLLCNTAWSTTTSITPSWTRQIILIIGSIIFWRKFGIVENLTNNLKDIGIAKFKWK